MTLLPLSLFTDVLDEAQQRIWTAAGHRFGIGTKAERRRLKRGVFRELRADPLTNSVIKMFFADAKIYALLVDGSIWRLFFRGGKTGRRRINQPYRIIRRLIEIDPGAFLGGGAE